MRVFALLGLLLGIGCVPLAATPTPASPDLRSFSTSTPPATAPLSPGVVVSAPAPLSSPTPYQYIIQSGDTMSQLAERLHVSLNALLAANPGVDPNALPLGQALTIPGLDSASGEATPTPVPLAVEQAACYPITDGGLWCFILIRNDGPDVVENVVAQVTLIGPDKKVVASHAAPLTLDILAPGQSLPLSVFFEPGAPIDATPEVQILSANRVLPGDPRYLAAEIQDSLVQVTWSGLSAQISGQVFLPAGSTGAKLVWVAAVAYDREGNVVGLRRWQASTELGAGASLPFSFMISSVAGRIDRVDFALEARR